MRVFACSNFGSIAKKREFIEVFNLLTITLVIATPIPHIEIRGFCVLALILRRVKADIDFFRREGYTVAPLPDVTPRIFDSPIFASVVSVRIASGISLFVICIPRPGGSLYIVGMPRLECRRVSVRPTSHNGLTVCSCKLHKEQFLDDSVNEEVVLLIPFAVRHTSRS